MLDQMVQSWESAALLTLADVPDEELMEGMRRVRAELQQIRREVPDWPRHPEDPDVYLSEYSKKKQQCLFLTWVAHVRRDKARSDREAWRALSRAAAKLSEEYKAASKAVGTWSKNSRG